MAVAGDVEIDQGARLRQAGIDDALDPATGLQVHGIEYVVDEVAGIAERIAGLPDDIAQRAAGIAVERAAGGRQHGGQEIVAAGADVAEAERFAEGRQRIMAELAGSPSWWPRSSSRP